ncbi:ScbA/BarX family gamma-butyrolactone biosynthesis protein [Streptomyces sp. NPDC006476]|uniref:ScbA/BarX family gamma-butyrolactone biosynthesis protein n=1 Tax=Streptomyces sp. NPDC006476 TaxID=3157175 RepID=UPI00339E8BF5
MPRETVHKSATAEVLLTDAARLDAGRFAVAAAWHRDHFLDDLGGRAVDPVLLAETARQAAIHLSHRFHGVPQGHHFVLGELAVELDGPLPAPDTAPLTLGLDAQCLRAPQHPRRTKLELDATVRTRHRRLGRARVRWEVLEPHRYALLRKRGTADAGAEPAPKPTRAVPLAPSRVGQQQDRDVLLSADPARADHWWLRLDLDHPVLFDHPSDHIPGMALVAAFRQAALVTTADPARYVRSLITRFTSFGELDLPVSVTAEHVGDAASTGRAVEILLRAEQGGRELASTRVVCALPCADHRLAGATC